MEVEAVNPKWLSIVTHMATAPARERLVIIPTGLEDQPIPPDCFYSVVRHKMAGNRVRVLWRVRQYRTGKPVRQITLGYFWPDCQSDDEPPTNGASQPARLPESPSWLAAESRRMTLALHAAQEYRALLEQAPLVDETRREMLEGVDWHLGVLRANPRVFNE